MPHTQKNTGFKLNGPIAHRTRAATQAAFKKELALREEEEKRNQLSEDSCDDGISFKKKKVKAAVNLRKIRF